MTASSKIESAALLHERLRLATLLRHVPTWSGVLSLCFHRVGEADDDAWERELGGISTAELDERLRLVRKHAEIIAPADLFGLERPPRGRHVLLTFDDGYRGWTSRALPVLSAHGVSAAFFIATGFIDRPRAPWWYEIPSMVRNATAAAIPAQGPLCEPLSLAADAQDRAVEILLDRYKATPGGATEAFLDWLGEATGSGRCDPEEGSRTWLSWDEVRTLRDAGMEVGGHTVDHPILARLDPDAQEAQITGCAQRIEAELGHRMRMFSYPVGLPDSFGPEAEALLGELDVELAFSYHGGFASHRQRLRKLNLPRVTGDMNRDIFEAMLTSPQIFGRW